jgi:hypothetical protein
MLFGSHAWSSISKNWNRLIQSSIKILKTQLSAKPPNAGIERLPARYTQPQRNHTTLMRGKLAGSPLE